MKKVSIVLIMVILINFICNNLVYADIMSDDSTIEYSEDSYNSLTEEGTTNLGGDSVEVSVTTSAVGTVAGGLASAISPIFMATTAVLSHITIQGGFKRTEGDYSASEIGWFSICSLVFDEYAMFDVNVYDSTSEITPSATEETTITKIIDGIKDNVLDYFKYIRIIALALSLVVFIFTIMRYAVATLAEDKYKYREALKMWVIAFVTLWLLPYIISFLNNIVGSISDGLYQFRINLENDNYSSFESTLFKACRDGVSDTGGLKCFAYFIEFTAFAVMEVKFFFKYIKRSFNIFVLIVISPIMMVLHVVDRLKGEEGMIKKWISQYTMNLIEQPLDALIYLIFMFMASEITLNAPLLAVAFLWALSRADKIIKLLLNMNDKKVSSLFSKSN